MNNFVESLYKRGVAVMGAGNMGAGIAQKIAQEGIPVYLCDRSSELAESGKKKISRLLSEAVERGIFSSKEAERTLSLVRTDLKDLNKVALAIEAVFEDFAVKSALFRELNEVCAADTIFATNTSSLSVEELARESGRPDRFGGLHFFYHPAKNRLLEVIACKSSSSTTELALWEFARATKKLAIKTSDSPGFAVNRFFVPWLNEAVRILDEGLACISEIEEAAKTAFKISMGPFELMNVTGIPIAVHAARSLGKAFGSFYEPADLLVKQAESGKLWELGALPSAKKRDLTPVQDRLLACVFYTAATLVEEGVATKEDCDRGATVGLRWAEGPFQMMNSCGTKHAFALIEKLLPHYPWQLVIPETLRTHAFANRPFALSYVELSTKDGIARISVNRPEAMNALNPEVTRQLKETFFEAENNPEVSAIVFEGIGKAFVAGADIRFFVDALDAGNFPCIYEFTKEGQDLFKCIASSQKPTVAFVNGIAYGGGAELALACQKIVVGSRAQFAFPETGIGIYPGLGGTQRLPRKIGKDLARFLIFTGQTLVFEDAIAIGLADACISDKQLVLLDDAARAKFCVQLDSKPKTGASRLPAWAQLAQIIFSEGNVDNTLAAKLPVSEPALGADLQALAERTIKILSYKAPLALELAHRLINSSGCPSIDEGLALELSSLKEIFSSQDAYEGLSSLGKRRPVYKGR